MRVLVACEFSGVVRDAFLAEGHDAISCDLLPTESPGPHIQGDVRPLLREPWDLVIAHPPCNYLSNFNNLYKNWDIVPDFWEKCSQATAFFLECYHANSERVAVENPMPMKAVSVVLGPPGDKVEPYHFGDPYRKKTWLWLRGLPPLMRDGDNPSPDTWVAARSNNAGTPWGGLKRSGKERSRTFPGMAAAMAKQWGNNS